MKSPRAADVDGARPAAAETRPNPVRRPVSHVQERATS
jgi:hypothetical protein